MLQRPADQDLGWRLRVSRGHLFDRLIAQHAASPQRAVGLAQDAQPVVHGHDLGLQVAWVQIDLVDGWLDFRRLQQFVQMFLRKGKRIAMKDYSFEEPFEKYPLAMAYVPWQHFTQTYEQRNQDTMYRNHHSDQEKCVCCF